MVRKKTEIIFFKEVAVKQNKLAVPGQTIWEQLAVPIWPGDHVAQPN